MSYKYRFSIITPTYNRGDFLPNVYKDLVNQTFKDFEWIVIGDVSCTDSTEEIMDDLISKHEIPIKFEKRSRMGLHNAWRTAYPLLEGQYCIRADDDDTYPKDMLEIFNRVWKFLEERNDYSEFWEIRGRCSRNNTIVGRKLSDCDFVSNYNDIVFRKRFGFTEMQSCWKSEVFKNEASVPERFPYDGDTINFPEHIMWSNAARKYKTYVINDVVRIYNNTTNSLSKTKERSKPVCYYILLFHLSTLNSMHDYLLRYNLRLYFHEILALCFYNTKMYENADQLLSYKIDKFLYRIFNPIFTIANAFKKNKK